MILPVEELFVGYVWNGLQEISKSILLISRKDLGLGGWGLDEPCNAC